MRLNINRSRDAVVDVIDIAYEIAEATTSKASNRFVDAVESGYEQIADMPGIGAPRDYGNPAYAEMRMWPVPEFRNYLIFDRVIGDELQILRVLHGARDLYAIFGPPEE